MILLVKSIILFFTFLFVFYRIGLIINKILKSKKIFEILIYGFVCTTAVLQIIYVPLMLLHVSFNIVLYLTISVIILLIIISFFLCGLEKEIFDKNFSKLRKMKGKDIIRVVILVGMILAQATISGVLYNENADDSFYVSLVEENKNSKSIYKVEPSLGIENTNNIISYIVSGHELALSVVSKIFSIQSTILCHTIIPFCMIIISYVAYYMLARKFLNSDKAQIFIILLSFVFLFSGFTTRLRGIILLSRMWQGKEIFLNIVLTLILSNLVCLNNYNKKKNLIFLTILNFSAVFFTNTAIFLVPFGYMGFGIINLLKKKLKEFLQLLCTGIPILIYAIIYLLVSYKTIDTGIATISIINVVKEFIGSGYYYILYICSLVIIMLKGSYRAKTYFLLVPLIYLLTLYNPLFTKIIAKYFTSPAVFWRVFWLLPMELSICYAFVKILNLKNSPKYKVIVFLIEILLLIIMGQFVYTKKNGYEIAENPNKIPQCIIDQTYYIIEKQKQYNANEKATVMAPKEPLHDAMMRQITSDVNLFWSRDMYMNNLYSKDDIALMNKINSIYNNEVPSIDYNEFNQIRKKYKINWIIINDDSQQIIEYLDNTDSESKENIAGYYIYQY